jgi:hypothetical protein
VTDLANFEEIRLNIRDEALSLCKRNDHAKVEQIHLLYAVGKVLGDTGSLNFLSLEVVEERLKLIPRATSIAIIVSGEFEAAYERVQDLESASKVANEIWESLSFKDSKNFTQDEQVLTPHSDAVESLDKPITDSLNLIPVPSLNNANVDPAEGEKPAPEDRREMLAKEISKLVTEKEEKHLQLSTIELEKQKIVGEFEDYLKAEEDLRDWRAERERSFAWKLITGTREIELKLQEDERKTLEFVTKPIELDDEFSKKTRNWVLKNLLINTGLFGAVCLALWLIRKFENSIIDFFSQNFSNGFVSFIAKLIVNLVLSINYAQVVLFTLLAFLLAFLGMLFGYSRRVDTYSYELAKHLEDTKVMEEAILQVRKGREKIGSLHPQIDPLLRIYSLSLHGPWAIDPRYDNFSATLPDTSEIPESLEFAVPTEVSINEKFEGLVLHTLNKIQQMNWRSDALDELVSSLMSSLGMPNSGDAVTQLETDQRMGGMRRVLLEQDQELRKRILLEIGDRKVKEYSRIVQDQILPKLQPDVKSLRPDPLEELELTDSLGVKQDTQVSTWEEKLRETAGPGTALSALNYSNSGKANSKHLEPIESMFICSKQIQADKSIDRQPEIDAGIRPFEVSIRVDLSSWCKPGDLMIFDGLESSTENHSDSKQSETPQESNLVF